MKSFKTLLLTVAVAGLTLVACSKKGGVDTSAFESSFKSADATAQSAADKVAASVKSEDYAGALSGLQDLSKDAKITPEQKSAVTDLITKVEQAIKDAGTKALDDTKKAAGDAVKDVTKSLKP